MSDKPTLSLCMIVRDSERPLAAALASARPFFEEMVVVDTGSIDATRDIARQHGAKVFDFPWCDDFSAARNCSLEQATGDWIFWMDADDILPPESGAELRRVIEGCPERNAAFWAIIEEQQAERGGKLRKSRHAHAKLFPRHPDIRFRYRIHEQISSALRQLGLPIKHTNIVVRHMTDRSPESERKRAERNLRLAYLDLKDRPDDPLVWMTLGTTYLHLTDCVPTAIYFLRRSVDGLQRGSVVQLKALLYLGSALGKSRDFRQEEQVYRQSLKLFPNEAALLMRLGSLFAKSGRIEQATRCYETILHQGLSRLPGVVLRDNRARAALRLGQLYLRAGQAQRAARCWQDFLEQHPDAQIVRQALQESFVSPSSIIVGPKT